MVRLIEVSLKRQGHELEVVNTARKCLFRLRESPPDVVVIDSVLPDMDGDQLARLIEQEEDLQNVRVYVLPTKLINSIWPKWRGPRIGPPGVPGFVVSPFNPMNARDLEWEDALAPEGAGGRLAT